MNLKIVFICASILLLSAVSHAQVIFSDNFDSQADWTIQQYNRGSGQPTNCYSGCDVPSGWNAYYNGESWCDNGPGHNTLNLNGDNPRGGSGKSLTYWDESCVDQYGVMEDSDGNVGKFTGTVYSEIYIRFYIKFQPGFQEGYLMIDSPAHKLLHLQYNCGTGTPFSYFGNPCNVPVSIPGIKFYNGNVMYYVSHRCEQDYYCQGTPSYDFDVGNDQDHVNLGKFTTVLGDGQWHVMEFYNKMNTNNGSTFNADGIHRFWLDGELKMESTNIPFSDSGSVESPRRGWNFFAIGGNNNNRWTMSCSGTSCEQWYSVDDVVVSTEYVGPESVPIGGYTGANSIPSGQVSQLTDGTGTVTINFKVLDEYNNTPITLNTFEYSTDGGTTWNAPTNGDSSGALSSNWGDNSYLSGAYADVNNTTSSEWGAATSFSFTLNAKHADVSALNSYDGNVRFRFYVRNGNPTTSNDPVQTDSFAMDTLAPAAPSSPSQ